MKSSETSVQFLTTKNIADFEYFDCQFFLISMCVFTKDRKRALIKSRRYCTSRSSISYLYSTFAVLLQDCSDGVNNREDGVNYEEDVV